MSSGRPAKEATQFDGQGLAGQIEHQTHRTGKGEGTAAHERRVGIVDVPPAALQS